MSTQHKKKVIYIFIIIAIVLVGGIYQTYMTYQNSSFRRFGVTYMTMNNPFMKSLITN